MIDAISLETAHLLGDALPQAHRLRYRLFVERQKYQVSSYHGMEWDQFDTPAAVYLLWRDESAMARAVARLIPTTMPYMIEELWPDLIEGEEPLSREDIWEVTRVGIDRSLDPATRRRVFGELICGMYEYAMLCGITEYLCVTPFQVLNNALKKAGCEFEVLGVTKKLGGLPVVAARVRLCNEGLEKVRAYHGVEPGVVHIVGDRLAA